MEARSRAACLHGAAVAFVGFEQLSDLVICSMVSCEPRIREFVESLKHTGTQFEYLMDYQSSSVGRVEISLFAIACKLSLCPTHQYVVGALSSGKEWLERGAGHWPPYDTDLPTRERVPSLPSSSWWLNEPVALSGNASVLYLGCDTAYSKDLPQNCQANIGIIPEIIPWALPSKSVSNSSFILPFDATWSELLIASLNKP